MEFKVTEPNVSPIVAGLEEMKGGEVFLAGSVIVEGLDVVEVDFRLGSQHAREVLRVRSHQKENIKGFKRMDPVPHRRISDADVLAQ
jgi:hypothetical protein